VAGAVVGTGSGLAIAVAAHTVVNARLLRRPASRPPETGTRLAVLVPARDEAPRIAALLHDLRAQRGVPGMTVTVLDDGSADGTAAVATGAAAGDPRIRVAAGHGRPPPGWLGKPAACDRLSRLAPPDADVLVFLDADVRLRPDALAAAAELLARSGLDLVCPWPRQLAAGPAERLVQPLLPWSWLATLPLRLAEQSPRPALSAANGQFLVVRAEAYRRAGGHAAVAGAVLEDLELLRAVKRAGGRGGPVNGSAIATCRMYAGAGPLRAGYRKSLWTAFGPPPAAAGLFTVLAVAFVLPAVAALAGRGRVRALGLAGYAAGVASRAVAARTFGTPGWPDAAAHPLSVLALAALTADSWLGHRRGTLTWKGRALPGARARRRP
jgi:hypothetical protein